MGDSPFFHEETRDCRRSSVLDRILDNSKPHHQFRLLRWLALVRSESADRLGSLATRRDLHDGSRVETFPSAREKKKARGLLRICIAGAIGRYRRCYLPVITTYPYANRSAEPRATICFEEQRPLSTRLPHSVEAAECFCSEAWDRGLCKDCEETDGHGRIEGEDSSSQERKSSRVWRGPVKVELEDSPHLWPLRCPAGGAARKMGLWT